MSRPKTEPPLITKIAHAFRAVDKIRRSGENKTRRYKYTRASDVFEAVRLELFSRGVLCCPSEGKPEYISIGPTHGGEQITECRLPVTYTFMDAANSLQPMTFNGVGRDLEDKALYKAQTGAQKALLKRFGLMAEEQDDPEFDSAQERQPDTLDAAAAPVRTAWKNQPLREFEIANFEEACAVTGKTQAEISEALCVQFKVASLAELKRGDFKRALSWASNGAGTLAPKPQAVPCGAGQGTLPLRTPPEPIEMKIGNKAISFEAKVHSFSI